MVGRSAALLRGSEQQRELLTHARLTYELAKIAWAQGAFDGQVVDLRNGINEFVVVHQRRPRICRAARSAVDISGSPNSAATFATAESACAVFQPNPTSASSTASWGQTSISTRT